jgi:aldose 1-epimerase
MQSAAANQTSFTVSITEKSFGIFENQVVTEYTLTNANGMQVSIINYGGAITKIITPDKNGNLGDVVTGFETLDGFLQNNNPFFGALVGRYGNRIAYGKFNLNGKEYTLAINNECNNLHGGNKGFDKVFWQIEKMSNEKSLKLSYLSKDGEEGFPGNLHVEVIYTLTEDNALVIDYTATTDQATPVNLTSHAYFNLTAGENPSILSHSLLMHASHYTAVNEAQIPTGEIKNVKDGPMDFTQHKLIGKDIGLVGSGYDHNWVLDKKENEFALAAELFEPNSGRKMDVWTTEPGIQFYTGNSLDEKIMNTKNAVVYCPHSALCLETQHFPDSPNQPAFPSTILQTGETYKQKTMYQFSVMAGV